MQISSTQDSFRQLTLRILTQKDYFRLVTKIFEAPVFKITFTSNITDFSINIDIYALIN